MRSHRHRIWVAMLLAVVISGSAACGDDGGSPTVPSVVDTQTDEEAARQSVDAWLSLIDAGNYSAAYEATGSLFRESVTAEDYGSRSASTLSISCGT